MLDDCEHCISSCAACADSMSPNESDTTKFSLACQEKSYLVKLVASIKTRIDTRARESVSKVQQMSKQKRSGWTKSVTTVVRIDTKCHLSPVCLLSWRILPTVPVHARSRMPANARSEWYKTCSYKVTEMVNVTRLVSYGKL